MDLKQALQQRGGDNASNSYNSKSDGDGGNNSSCSNNTSSNTNSEESNRGASPVPSVAPLLLCGGSQLLLSCNSSKNFSVSLPTRARPASELDGVLSHDPHLLKLARVNEPTSPHSSALETQVLINLNGSLSSSAAQNSSIGATANHSSLFSSYLSSNNHGSPISNYAVCTSSATTANSFINGSSATSANSFINGSSNHSKVYPFASMHESPVRQHTSPFLLSGIPAPQASILGSARAHHGASLPCFNSEPEVTSLFTPEQLLEFTQQTFVFKHFAAGVAPPVSLLLPIINSVASTGRIGGGSLHYGSNAGLFGVGSFRGNIDPEPGRCRRTDGKKWRCGREVVADQKYCERHMHRGRHRARNKGANSGMDPLNTSCANLPLNAASNTSNAPISSGISTSIPSAFPTNVPKEPHLHFSLQPASAVSTQLKRSNTEEKPNGGLLSDVPTSGLKRLLENNNIGGPLPRSLAAENPPNLAELLDPTSAAASAKSSSSLQMLPLKNHDNLDPPFPFSCQNSCDRDADNLALRHFGDGDQHWSRINRVADNPPTASLSWFDQLAEEQNKRSRFNTELSIATTHKSPLINLSTKFGGDQEDTIVGVDASHFMGLSMDLGPKVSSIAKLEEDRYSGRSSWVPIAWESPAIGGPLGEVLQSNAANSGGNYGGNLAKVGGERCLNLIEDESWVHQEGAHLGSPAKDSQSHSPSLASPTGVLQMKASFASYSDSSSSASSPRSALKLDSSANLGI